MSARAALKSPRSQERERDEQKFHKNSHENIKLINFISNTRFSPSRKSSPENCSANDNHLLQVLRRAQELMKNCGSMHGWSHRDKPSSLPAQLFMRELCDMQTTTKHSMLDELQVYHIKNSRCFPQRKNRREVWAKADFPLIFRLFLSVVALQWVGIGVDGLSLHKLESSPRAFHSSFWRISQKHSQLHPSRALLLSSLRQPGEKLKTLSSQLRDNQ